MAIARYEVAVNSKTDGKFTLLHINGRPHILTDMVPIVGDTVMNQIMYPDAEVTNSMEQLDHLPAPNGHPQVEGENVSAFHPLATNAHNIGGFVRSPSKAGPEVHCQFCLDLAVAKGSDDGKELVRRIKGNEKVGVSTGLTLELEAKKGKGKADGMDFTAVAHNLQFDHVAVLLNEQAAGDHVGTELKLNTGDDADVLPEPAEGAIFICNVVPADDGSDEQNVSANDLRDKLQRMLTEALLTDVNRQSLWVQDVVDDTVIFELRAEGSEKLMRAAFTVSGDDVVAVDTDGAIEVERRTSYVPVEQAVQATQENETMTVDEAKEFLVGEGYTVTNDEGMKLIEVAEHDAYTEWRTAKETALNEKRAKLVDASDFSDEDVAVMGEVALGKLLALNEAQPIVDNSLRGGGAPDANGTPELRKSISAAFGR